MAASLQTRRWTRLLLAVLLVDVFVVPPMLAIGVMPYWLAAVVTTASLLVTAAALAGHHGARGVILTVAVVAIAGHWLHGFRYDTDAVAILAVVATAIAGWTFAGLFLVDAFGKGKLQDRLIAVLLAYVFLGSAWAQTYHAIDLAIPGALAIPEKAHPASSYIYFSFSTLTSVGFGDIVPVNPIARSLAVLEALTGQLYLVIVVARFAGEAAISRSPDG